MNDRHWTNSWRNRPADMRSTSQDDGAPPADVGGPFDMTRLPVDRRLKIADDFVGANPRKPVSELLLELFPELKSLGSVQPEEAVPTKRKAANGSHQRANQCDGACPTSSSAVNYRDILQMDYRQQLVDAAVVELRYQLDPLAVDQHGTHVQIEGGFKMARVIEAVMRIAFDQNEAMIEEVARSIAPRGDDWTAFRETAVDAITAVRGSILAQLDPLP